jgi:hypothetical protein
MYLFKDGGQDKFGGGPEKLRSMTILCVAV